jgi:dimethylargininase
MRLPAEPDLPDSVFVEDTAIALDELAIITRPGAISRRAETGSVASSLSQFRPLTFIQPPATLEGGDVMRVNRMLYVGLSARTNSPGITQLCAIVKPYGYEVRVVEVTGCLHLKTACAHLGGRAMLVNPRWINVKKLMEFDLINVPRYEPWAANALAVGDTVLTASLFPETRELLEERGFDVHTIDISEFQKAEAGLTCLSLIF